MSHNHFAGCSLVALISHQCALMIIVDHLVSSPHVTDRSCASLLALTMTLEPILVVSIHMISQLTSADLPIPRPELTASRSVSMSTLPLFSCMCDLMSRSTWRCHMRGPPYFASGVFSCPHGKANNTNASGSSLTAGDHNRVISSCSSSGLYIGFCMC